MKIAVFVISLADAEQRRRVITDYLSRLGLPWSFFDARRYDPSDQEVSQRADMTPGEIGCFLSHRALWNHIATSDLDYAVILEDDTVLLPTLDYHALFAALRRLDVECIRLAINGLHCAKSLVGLGVPLGKISRITSPRFGLGAMACAVTPRAAHQLHLAASDIRTQIDLWLERYHNHRLAIFSLSPPCAVIMRCFPTTIQGRKTPQPPSFLDYARARAAQFLADRRDDWQLSKLDNALRCRADALEPGTARWPYSQLRRQLKRFLRWSRSL
jgi:glycosyl transferase family 25